VASVQRTLTALANADWVAKEKERNAYRFTMELVRRWIAEERPVSALTEAQQTEIASKTASFWQQRRAWTVDALTLILLFLLGFLPLALVTGPGTAAVFGLLCPFVVLFGPLRFGCGTLGMRIFRLQVTPAPGHALDTKSTATLAALYMLRATSTLMVIALVAALFDQGAEPAVSVFGGVAAILETLDHVMIWRGEKRQGLWDKLGGVLVIPAEVVRS
jgi:hypothetical protein